MENILGLLRIRVIRGINLPKRDFRSSYPYVIITFGKQFVLRSYLGFPRRPTYFMYFEGYNVQKVKTRAVKKNVNPEWNEELTLSIADVPNIPIILRVYDRHKVTRDDEIGDTEFDIRPFLELITMHLDNIIDGTAITTMKPNGENFLAEESCIEWENGQVVQHMFLRLRNAEWGEIELKLHWIDGSSSRNAV